VTDQSKLNELHIPLIFPLSLLLILSSHLDDRGLSPAEAKDFSSTSVSRPALGPTLSPVQCVQDVNSPGVKRARGVTLTDHAPLMPR
jgi:hypothetical protein